MDLRDKIQTINILNDDKEESTLSASSLKSEHDIKNNSYIVSDADEELLILVEFKKMINLQSMKIYSIELDKENDEISPPKEIDIFKIKNLNKDFNDIKELKPDISTICSVKKLGKGQKINLQKKSKNAIKFSSISYLAIYIKSNQKDTESTYFNFITFQGKQVKEIKGKDYFPDFNNAKWGCLRCTNESGFSLNWLSDKHCTTCGKPRRSILEYGEHKDDDDDEKKKEDNENDEMQKYIKLVNSLEVKQKEEKINISDYKDKKDQHIIMYLFFLFGLFETGKHLNHSNENDKFSNDKKDPFKLFIDYKIVWSRLMGQDDENDENESEISKLIQLYGLLNNLEKKVYLLKYFKLIDVDLPEDMDPNKIDGDEIYQLNMMLNHGFREMRAMSDEKENINEMVTKKWDGYKKRKEFCRDGYSIMSDDNCLWITFSKKGKNWGYKYTKSDLSDFGDIISVKKKINTAKDKKTLKLYYHDDNEDAPILCDFGEEYKLIIPRS